MIDTIHEAFIEELKKIAAVGVYTPGAAKLPKSPKRKSPQRIVKSPRIPKLRLQEAAAVPGDNTIRTLSS